MHGVLHLQKHKKGMPDYTDQQLQTFELCISGCSVLRRRKVGRDCQANDVASIDHTSSLDSGRNSTAGWAQSIPDLGTLGNRYHSNVEKTHLDGGSFGIPSHLTIRYITQCSHTVPRIASKLYIKLTKLTKLDN